MKRENSVLVISGASAAGKTAVASLIAKNDPRFTSLRSATTRERRADGNDSEYIYLTEEEFRSKIDSGEVLEHMIYDGCMYGTLYSEMQRAFGEGRVPLLVLDVKGLVALSTNKSLSVCTVFVYSSLDVIEGRLYNRYLATNPTEHNKERFFARKKRNIEDYLGLPEIEPYIYAFADNSGTIDECAASVLDIFDAFSNGAPRDKQACKSTAEKLRCSALEI